MIRRVPDMLHSSHGDFFFKLTVTEKITEGGIQVPLQCLSPTINPAEFTRQEKKL